MTGDDRLEVRAPGDAKQPLFFVLQQLVAVLPGVIVQVRALGWQRLRVMWGAGCGCVCVGVWGGSLVAEHKG